MSDHTQDLVDAKLSATEARIEARLVGIDGKLDRLADQMTAMSAQVKEAKEASTGAKDSVATMKWHILATVLGAVAIVFAMWTIWAQGMELISALLSQPTTGAGQ